MRRWLLLFGVLAGIAGCNRRAEEMRACAEICGPGNVKAFGMEGFFIDEPICTCWGKTPDAGAR